MPTSSTENKNIAKLWIDELNPKHILDIGVGKGTYSELARTPEQTWTGIEAYYPYVQEFDLDGKYDDVIIGDARYIDYNKLPKNTPDNPLISLYTSKSFRRNQSQFVVFITPIIKNSASAGSEKIKAKFRLRE